VVIVEGEWAVLGVNLWRPVVTNETATHSATATLSSQITLWKDLLIRRPWRGR